MAGAPGDLRFDLVTATVDRTAPLEELLRSLAAQTHRAFRLVVVDQNADDRVAALLASHRDLEVLHLRSTRGLSRARNVALPRLAGDLVAFPDDDCVYAPDLLERVARAIRGRPGARRPRRPRRRGRRLVGPVLGGERGGARRRATSGTA